MTKNQKVANIITFLIILFGEDFDIFSKILDFHPDYIIEKFERYVLSVHEEYEWGMHPILKLNVFHEYMSKWELDE